MSVDLPQNLEADESPSLRQRKKLATRRALRAAAIRLGAQRGFGHFTVDDVAAEADVSERTFFNYFGSKEAAIVGEDPQWIDRLEQKIARHPAGTPPFALARLVALDQAAWIEHTVDELGEDRSWWTSCCRAMIEDPGVRAAYAKHMIAVERTVTAALAHSLGVDPDTDAVPALVTSVAMAAVRVAHGLWRRGGAEGSLVEITEKMLAALPDLVRDTEPSSASPQETHR